MTGLSSPIKQQFKIYYRSKIDNREYHYDGIGYEDYEICLDTYHDALEQFPDIEFFIYVENHIVS